MKKIFYFLFVSLLVISCSSDNEDPVTPIDNPSSVAEGKQVFRIQINELSAKTIFSKQKDLEPAFALVSINDSDGTSILTREKIVLTKKGDSFITAEIALDVGTYSLIEFIVTDINDVVISIAPKENSVLAEFASSALPFDFEVSADEVKETDTENINAAGYTSVDFGYTGLSLTFPENTDFFSITVDDSEVLDSKVLKLESITGSTYLIDWGDGVTEEYVSSVSNSGIENTIAHTYAQNGIYTINVSGAVEAIELLDFGSDQENGFRTHTTSVNIENLTLLKSCQLYAGNLTTLNTSENEALEFLGLGYNQVSSLDFINNPNLKTVWLRYNQLTALDISQNPNLEYLWVEGNQISNLDLSNNSNLKVVLARDNNLSSIDFTGNLNLERVDLSDNSIPIINVSANLGLKEINVGRNQLTTIDLSQNTELIRADLYTNQIGAIDLSANLKLRDLYITNNPLTEIDLSANTKLERLIIENNSLSGLDITANPKIFDLEIGSNQLSAPQLDQIFTQIYDQAVLNSIVNGYINYKNNPGSADINAITISKLNELEASYNWVVSNN
jgi:Leucine Rich Repeat (LRR) protein